MSPHQLQPTRAQKTQAAPYSPRQGKLHAACYCNLQLYPKLGLWLKKVHQKLKFEQNLWMKQYIEFNTELRKKTTSYFEKTFLKHMNNSVFSKTMENLRNRINVKLVRAGEKENLHKLISSPLYAHRMIFGENLAAIHMHKDVLKLVKLVYTDMNVLELSKLLMYEFYYNYLKKIYEEKCKLLYYLLLEIETEDVHKDIRENLDLYNTSNYAFLHLSANKKVVEKMKDEYTSTPIEEVVCLRSKTYSIKMLKAKGTTKAVTKKELYEQKIFWHGTRSRSPLSTCDDGVHTLAYGPC